MLGVGTVLDVGTGLVVGKGTVVGRVLVTSALSEDEMMLEQGGGVSELSHPPPEDVRTEEVSLPEEKKGELFTLL